MPYKWGKCFVQTCTDFCNNTTLHGWNYIGEPNRSKTEKLIWWLVQILAITSAIYLFLVMSSEFWSAPTATTLESSNYHISNVPFPGVAICDINRISKTRAYKVAERLHVKYNQTVEKMFFYMQWFGRIYDNDIDDINTVNEFVKVLERNDYFDYQRFISLMLELTPPCNELILRCVWKGKEVDCKKLFRTRRTQDGFCCTFNYIKSPEHVFLKTDIDDLNDTSLEISGYEMGLTVLLRSNVSDYYYPLSNMEGLKIFLFNSHDYPDVTSGGVVETLVPLGQEIFLQIEPTTVNAVDELKTYSISKRGCVFNSEGTTAFDSIYYSYSDCIVECKVKSMLALCECIPFYFAVSSQFGYSNQLCTLADTLCLNKYKEKWMTLSPPEPNEDLETEIDNSIICPLCYPTCSYTTYAVLNEYSPLVTDGSQFIQGLNINEISIVHLYFDKEETRLYRTDLYFHWFDIISNFGGLCGVFIGFSIISVIEIIYFFVFRYLLLVLKSKE